MRSILFGNGINIQYGGADKYSNGAIIKRLITNIQNGKYDTVIPDMTSGELLNFFNDLADCIRKIGGLSKYHDGLFMLMEIDRIQKKYKTDTPIDEIGFEDFFIVLELISNKHHDNEEFRSEAERGLRMLFLDAIYDGGNINRLTYPNGLIASLSRYDNVFTINYDSNLERYHIGVNHLHGQFDVLAPEFEVGSSFSLTNPDKCRSSLVIPGFEHIYSNSIMSWYWLDKYGEWIDKEGVYGADKFKGMKGSLDIVGMSSCNDEHLFLMINQSALSHVTYYYKTDEDRTQMSKRIKKPITYTNVEKFWRSVET